MFIYSTVSYSHPQFIWTMNTQSEDGAMVQHKWERRQIRLRGFSRKNKNNFALKGGRAYTVGVTAACGIYNKNPSKHVESFFFQK